MNLSNTVGIITIQTVCIISSVRFLPFTVTSVRAGEPIQELTSVRMQLSLVYMYSFCCRGKVERLCIPANTTPDCQSGPTNEGSAYELPSFIRRLGRPILELWIYRLEQVH